MKCPPPPAPHLGVVENLNHYVDEEVRCRCEVGAKARCEVPDRMKSPPPPPKAAWRYGAKLRRIRLRYILRTLCVASLLIAVAEELALPSGLSHPPYSS